MSRRSGRPAIGRKGSDAGILRRNTTACGVHARRRGRGGDVCERTRPEHPTRAACQSAPDPGDRSQLAGRDRRCSHLPRPGRARDRPDAQPILSAATAALSTAIGAFIPVIPFFFMRGYPAVIVAATVSLLAHFAVGAAKTLITVHSWWSSGLEMTIVGAVEGIVTYVIGLGLGHLGG
jgi:VIT1/CCC1 family predicted Fe2+/Mn2+ transporter